MIVPAQAAILCGGLGKRLRPITDKLPKPMVPVNGRPFLEHLMVQLRENGIREVVLMTGYLGEQIHDYFGDGNAFGMDIQYSHGPIEWDTGRRLYEAMPLLRQHFLLLYSDNFVQFNLRKLSRFYQEKEKLISFIVQEKQNGNIRLMADGIVDVYDKTRSASNLQFVELGYMLVDKNIFEYYDDIDVSFSNILSKLVLERQVSGMIVRDVYHSISDPKRLKLAEGYLKDKKILLIDRDGVINEKAPKGEYICRWSDFHFISESIRGMKRLSNAGYYFIVISNQAAIGRGILTTEEVLEINRRMSDVLGNEGIRILDIYLCPHHWEDNCYCRKPNPGLFFQASREWIFRLDKTYYIGDDPRDCQAAYNAGCMSIYMGNSNELKHLSREEQPRLIVKTLEDVVSYLGEV